MHDFRPPPPRAHARAHTRTHSRALMQDTLTHTLKTYQPQTDRPPRHCCRGVCVCVCVCAWSTSANPVLTVLLDSMNMLSSQIDAYLQRWFVVLVALFICNSHTPPQGAPTQRDRHGHSVTDAQAKSNKEDKPFGANARFLSAPPPPPLSLSFSEQLRPTHALQHLACSQLDFEW